MAKRAAAGGESLELSLKMGLSAITISLGIIIGTNVDKLLINSYIYIYIVELLVLFHIINYKEYLYNMIYDYY